MIKRDCVFIWTTALNWISPFPFWVSSVKHERCNWSWTASTVSVTQCEHVDHGGPASPAPVVMSQFEQKVKNCTTLIRLHPLSHFVRHDLNVHSLTPAHYSTGVLLAKGSLPPSQRSNLAYLIPNQRHRSHGILLCGYEMMIYRDYRACSSVRVSRAHHLRYGKLHF